VRFEIYCSYDAVEREVDVDGDAKRLEVVIGEEVKDATSVANKIPKFEVAHTFEGGLSPPSANQNIKEAQKMLEVIWQMGEPENFGEDSSIKILELSEVVADFATNTETNEHPFSESISDERMISEIRSNAGKFESIQATDQSSDKSSILRKSDEEMVKMMTEIRYNAKRT
jgi:hypothetical protein